MFFSNLPNLALKLRIGLMNRYQYFPLYHFFIFEFAIELKFESFDCMNDRFPFPPGHLGKLLNDAFLLEVNVFSSFPVVAYIAVIMEGESL